MADLDLPPLDPKIRKELEKWARRAEVSPEQMAARALEAYVRLALSVPEALPGNAPGRKGSGR